MASLSKIKVGTTEYDLKATYDSNGNQIVDTYVLKKGDTMTGTLNVPTINNYNVSTAVSIATGTNAGSYFQSQKFRGQGNAGTYNHAIDFGYAGHNQVDFYEYGGIWNFWMNNQSTAVTDKATKLALTIGLDSLSNKSYTYTWPNKTGTFAITDDIVQSDWSVTDESSKAFIKNKPTIPEAVTVDSALSSTSTNPVQNKIIKAALDGKQAAGSYAAASHTHTKSQITDFPTIPTKTSQLTNDSGYMTTIKAASGSNIGSVGTPSVSATTSGTTTTFTFDYLKGEKGDKGDKGDAGASGAPTYQPSTWSLIFS